MTKVTTSEEIVNEYLQHTYLWRNKTTINKTVSYVELCEQSDLGFDCPHMP